MWVCLGQYEPCSVIDNAGCIGVSVIVIDDAGRRIGMWENLKVTIRSCFFCLSAFDHVFVVLACILPSDFSAAAACRIFPSNRW